MTSAGHLSHCHPLIPGGRDMDYTVRQARRHRSMVIEQKAIENGGFLVDLPIENGDL